MDKHIPKMRKILLPSALICLIFVFHSCTQFLTDLQSSVGGVAYTEQDAAGAIREALVKGTNKGVEIVSVVDGYLGNPQIKIPFPPEAAQIESTLRSAGFGNLVDQAVTSINRAAELAAAEAKPIFVSAITGMTITDAINIVKGPDNAATEYLKRTTTLSLTGSFQPVISAALDKVNATRYWGDLINTYNKIPLVKKMDPDLSRYVTTKAIDGLFVMIAREELEIRKDPLARTTELLRKVFGNCQVISFCQHRFLAHGLLVTKKPKNPPRKTLLRISPVVKMFACLPSVR